MCIEKCKEAHIDYSVSLLLSAFSKDHLIKELFLYCLYQSCVCAHKHTHTHTHTHYSIPFIVHCFSLQYVSALSMLCVVYIFVYCMALLNRLLKTYLFKNKSLVTLFLRIVLGIKQPYGKQLFNKYIKSENWQNLVTDDFYILSCL